MSNRTTLRDLVLKAIDRHQTSGRQLAFMAQGHGFDIAVTTINHLKAGTYRYTPSPETVRAIAWLAGVDDSVAFTAAGQTVPGPPFAQELPPGVDNLSPKARKAVIEMLRVLVDAEADSNEDQDKPKTNPPGPRTLRAVGSGREVVAGQKNTPEDPEFLKPLEREQMAAHPNVKLHRDKFDEIYGDAGEENQDTDGE